MVMLAFACSSSAVEDGPIGVSHAQLTVATNYPAVQANMHDVDAVAAKFPGGNNWHWVTAVNNQSETTPGCAGCVLNTDSRNRVGFPYSTDLTGSMWIDTPTTLPPNGTEETAPWKPPQTPTSGNFIGWVGDPSIATIGDGTKVLITNLVATTKNPGAAEDVGMLLSSDGGQTFGTPTLVTHLGIAGGGDVDQPQVVTNHDWPNSTIVAWQSNSTPGPPTAWITSINNVTLAPNSSSAWAAWNMNSGTGNANNPKTVFNLNNNGFVRPKIAVGSMPWTGSGTGCNDGSTHELVYVVWSNVPLPRQCAANPGGSTNASWTMAIFDQTLNEWSSITYPIDNDLAWPYCVGQALDNDATPFVATDGPHVAIAHNESSRGGARIHVSDWVATCNNGHVFAAPAGIYQSPTYCYATGGGAWCPPGQVTNNGVGGTTVVNDQWGARVAFQSDTKGPHLLVTYYDTSMDTNNTLVNIRGGMNASGFGGSPFYDTSANPTVFQISQNSGTPSGQVVPWAMSRGSGLDYWLDYQAIGVDWVTHTFLAAWGGDMRLANNTPAGPSGIWTAVITP